MSGEGCGFIIKVFISRIKRETTLSERNKRNLNITEV